ncbi:hypothetical protein T484DRAFT_1779361 [Baffinella frigidus]|nr:hypothetical protein T484DRAFT_1779361 [Cryptophyta sp. CCMP2293]
MLAASEGWSLRAGSSKDARGNGGCTAVDGGVGECLAGYTAAADGVQCRACEVGTFKSAVGNATCETCPPNSESSSGSAVCQCSPGFTVASDGVAFCVVLILDHSSGGAHFPRWGQDSSVSACSLNATWDDVIRRAWLPPAGGLGPLTEKPRFQVWLCEEGHPCANGTSAFFCFVFDEEERVFVPWGPNSQLRLVDIAGAAAVRRNSAANLRHTRDTLAPASTQVAEDTRGSEGQHSASGSVQALLGEWDLARHSAVFAGLGVDSVRDLQWLTHQDVAALEIPTIPKRKVLAMLDWWRAENAPHPRK